MEIIQQSVLMEANAQFSLSTANLCFLYATKQTKHIKTLLSTSHFSTDVTHEA